jgi:NAD(P)H dehydrogenase (quinone)
MNVFVVLAHPEPQSFNGAMFRLAVTTLQEVGHPVATSDLTAMGFDPVSGRNNFSTVKNAAYFDQQAEEQHASDVGGFAPDVEAEIRKAEACDLMIWQFPLWWFGLPGVLKGWVDRVFAMGRTYGYRRIYERGVFRGKRAMLSLTTGGPAKSYVRGGYIGDMDAILRPIHRGILQFVGFDVLAPQIVYGPAKVEHRDREEALLAYADRLRNIATESPIEVGDY